MNKRVLKEGGGEKALINEPGSRVEIDLTKGGRVELDLSNGGDARAFIEGQDGITNEQKEIMLEAYDNGFKIAGQVIWLCIKAERIVVFKVLSANQSAALRMTAMAFEISLDEACSVLLNHETTIVKLQFSPAQVDAAQAVREAQEKYNYLLESAKRLLSSSANKSHEEINLLGRLVEQFSVLNARLVYAGIEPLEKPPEVKEAGRLKRKFHYKPRRSRK